MPSASHALEASPPFSPFQNPLWQPMMVIFLCSNTGSKEEEDIYYTPGQQFELIWRLTRQVMAVWIGVRVSGGKRSGWLVVELQGIRAQKEEEKDGSARTRSHNRFERLSHSHSLLVLIWHVRQQQHGCRKWGHGRSTDLLGLEPRRTGVAQRGFTASASRCFSLLKTQRAKWTSWCAQIPFLPLSVWGNPELWHRAVRFK